MEETNYIALAIPVFFVLIGIELLVSRWQGRHYYRLNDSINDLSCGIIQQLLTALCASVIIFGYLVIHAHARLLDWPAESALTWALCFVLLDLAYYWFHRLSHEINFMWAAHIVHHQSEEYNLTVALRQSSFQPFMSMVFYWPLALLGFPPLVFAACASFNTLYQFWIHTREIQTLGPLESILMTPSHHRVHHGRNPIYIDRNHGGTFIIWDKLFGTFEPESEEVSYGITTPLASWNPVWANLHYWSELRRTAARTADWRDKLRVYLKPPGWYPAELGGFQPPPPISEAQRKFDPPVQRRTAAYALLHFAQLGGLSVGVIFLAGTLSFAKLLIASVLVIWGLTNLGILFESPARAGRSEWLRLLATPVLLAPMLPSSALGWLLAFAVLNLAAAGGLPLRWSDPETAAPLADPAHGDG
jgi:sterol desaturase/sphingolipid hydroxylase (fatty acid hydroxylase superfamily)